jgi:hypothetical protein
MWSWVHGYTPEMIDMWLGDGDDFRGITLALAVLKTCGAHPIVPENVQQLVNHPSRIFVERAHLQILIAFTRQRR